MSDPVTRAQLEEALDNKLKEHKEHHDHINKLLDNHNKAIHGSNGTPGLRIRVDRIETTSGTLKKVFATLVGLWGLVLAWLGLKDSA